MGGSVPVSVCCYRIIIVRLRNISVGTILSSSQRHPKTCILEIRNVTDEAVVLNRMSRRMIGE